MHSPAPLTLGLNDMTSSGDSDPYSLAMKLSLALALAAAVLAACGGADDADADKTAASSTSASSVPETSEAASTTGFASAEELRAAVLDADPDLTCRPARVQMGGGGPNIFYDQGWVNGADECKAPGRGRVFLSFWESPEDQKMAFDQALDDYKSGGMPVLAGSNWAVTGDDYDVGSLQEALGGELLT